MIQFPAFVAKRGGIPYERKQMIEIGTRVKSILSLSKVPIYCPGTVFGILNNGSQIQVRWDDPEVDELYGALKWAPNNLTTKDVMPLEEDIQKALEKIKVLSDATTPT